MNEKFVLYSFEGVVSISVKDYLNSSDLNKIKHIAEEMDCSQQEILEKGLLDVWNLLGIWNKVERYNTDIDFIKSMTVSLFELGNAGSLTKDLLE